MACPHVTRVRLCSARPQGYSPGKQENCKGAVTVNQSPSLHPAPASALPRRRLGRTGLDVSILGFGTAPLGDLFARLDDATAIAAAERAFALGVNLLDSSPLYGHGLAEHRCGTALR